MASFPASRLRRRYEKSFPLRTRPIHFSELLQAFSSAMFLKSDRFQISFRGTICHHSCGRYGGCFLLLATVFEAHLIFCPWDPHPKACRRICHIVIVIVTTIGNPITHKSFYMKKCIVKPSTPNPEGSKKLRGRDGAASGQATKKLGDRCWGLEAKARTDDTDYRSVFQNRAKDSWVVLFGA